MNEDIWTGVGYWAESWQLFWVVKRSSVLDFLMIQAQVSTCSCLTWWKYPWHMAVTFHSSSTLLQTYLLPLSCT